MSLDLEPRQTWTEVFPVVKDVFREGGAVANPAVVGARAHPESAA